MIPDRYKTGIYDGEYFELIQLKNISLSVNCKLCNSILKTNLGSKSNIYKHLQSKHIHMMQQILKSKQPKTWLNFSVNRQFQIKLRNARAEKGKGDSEHYDEESMVKNCPDSGGGGGGGFGGDIENMDEINAELIPTTTNKKELTWSIPTEGDIEYLAEDAEVVQENSTNHNDPLNETTLSNGIIIADGGIGTDVCDDDEIDDGNCSGVVTTDRVASSEIIDFQYPVNLLTPPETNDILTIKKKQLKRQKEMLEEKHAIEMEMLKRELEFKTIEHKKKIAYLDLRLNNIV